MSSWGTELWDQYDTLSFHTQRGIEFLERCAHFNRDRSAIEMDYAAKLRKLVKTYQPKKKEEEELQYSSCKAFKKVLGEVTDLAGQHEIIAENLQSEVVREVMQLVKEFKEERKKCLQDGAKYMAALASQMGVSERAKKNYEKAYKEAEKALESFQRADLDLNLSRAEVEKFRLNMAIKSQHCEETKEEYVLQLQKTNELQRNHYKILMPEVFRQLQELDEKRIRNIKNFMVHSAEVERKVFPILNQCLDGIVNAANEINEKEDVALVVERYKSGFSIPEDALFEDLSCGEPSNNTPTRNTLPHSNTKGDHRTMKGTLSSGKLKKRGVLLGIFSSNKNNITSWDKEDFSDLPPNQRRKRLQQRLDELHQKLQQEVNTKDGLMKMKGVYERNSALGDPMSVEGQLNESSHKLDKLRTEIQKYQTLLEEVDKNSPAIARKSSYANVNGNSQHNGNSGNVSMVDGRRNSAKMDEDSLSRSASESSVSPNQNGMTAAMMQHNKPMGAKLPNLHGYSNSPESGISTSHTSLPDFEQPELYDPPSLGTCRALFPFDATSEGSIPMYEGELLLIIEVDQGDGWTRVRRQGDTEEGFVPTSYIDCNL